VVRVMAGETCVVEALQVKDGGVEIMEVDRLFLGPHAVLGRGAVDDTGFPRLAEIRRTGLCPGAGPGRRGHDERRQVL
jgi:hypothetical protein